MGPDEASLLAPTVRERARVLAPSLLVVLVVVLAASGPLGIQPVGPWRIGPWAAAIVLAGITVALVLRKVPDRWIHLASASVLWCVYAATLTGLAATREGSYALILSSLVTSTGVLLHRAYAIGTLVVAVAVSVPLVARIHEGHVATRLLTLAVGAGFAIVIHALMRRAFLRSESMRIAEAEHRHELARQLAELERAHAERASLQEQLLHAQRMEAIGTLAAGVAHDMNNVLASITTFASLALEHSRDVALRADLGQIIAQADRGAALTRGLLAFSRRGQYRKQTIYVDEAVNEVVPLLRQTLPKTLTIRAEHALEAACVDADPVQLHQVLINLGLNAADAMDHAGVLSLRGSVVTLGAGDVPSLPAGRYVRLLVSDTGKGMDAATRLRVFEPFFTTKPQGQGTGLGLAIVWGIVHAHHGAIDVESEPGKGTTFRIHLPVSEATPAPRQVTQPMPPPLAISPATRTSTVLVVDDEPAVRTGAKRLLERLGVTVLVAGDGEEALRVFAAQRDQIDLVILDMGMPVMGGAECFRRLRAESQVPVLITTGYASDHDAQMLVAGGAVLLEKPYTSSMLREEVTRILEASHGGQAAAVARARRPSAAA